MTTEQGFASLMRSANHYHQKWKQVESNIKRNTVKVQDLTPTTQAKLSQGKRNNRYRSIQMQEALSVLCRIG
jgi:hypothetical protein